MTRHRWPFLDHPGPLAFAHRGGAEEAPENSMAAFAAAVRLGYRYLETDVHATRDGALIAYHDSTLDRVTDRTGVVAQLPWAEVRHARIDGREPIPLLEDVLGTWPSVRLNIDPKSDAAADRLAEVLRRTGAIDRVCIGSFSDRRLSVLRRRLGEGLCTSMGPRAVARLRLRSWGLPLGMGDAACVQVPVVWHGLPVIDRRLVATVHRCGLQVHAWTIDDEDTMRRLLDLGVDGLMTDRPSLLKRVLQERGTWIDP